MKKNCSFCSLINLGILIVLCLNILAVQSKALEKSESKYISEDKLNELNLLINGSFFDKRRNKINKNFNLLYYALSSDGKYSSLTLCDAPSMHGYDCVDLNDQFLTKKSCEKISNQKCHIIINRDRLNLNNQIFNIGYIKKDYFLEIVKKQNITILKIDENKETAIRFTRLFSSDLDD